MSTEKKVTPKTAFINDFMTTDPDYTAALAAWAEARGEVGTGFKAEFFSFLEEGEKTEAEMDEFLKDRSPNVVKNRANWNGIRGMANRIWEAK